jgi:hypothetical protein
VIHGGAPFKELSVGQEFHFPADPKAFQHRSQAYVKLSSRRYAPRRNHPARGHAWNTYVHEVGTVNVRVDPGDAVSTVDLAEVLRAVDETKRQDRAAARGMTEGRPARLPVRALGQGGGAKLTYQERRAAPDSDFALEAERKFYVGDATHAADAMSRLSGSWNMGHLTAAQYERAHDRIVQAETRFGVQHHGGHDGPLRCPYPPSGTHAGGGGANMVPGVPSYAASHSGWTSSSSGCGGGARGTARGPVRRTP